MRSRIKKTVLTGANGFLGSTLSRRLLDENLRPIGIVRETSDLSFLDGVNLDLKTIGLRNPDSLVEVFSGADVVFHCASRTSDWGPMEAFWTANVEHTERVVRAAARADVSRLVYVGSTVVYGFGGHRNTDETAPKQPDSFPYCVTKFEAEKRIRKLGRENGLPYTIIRPGNVYGPRDRVTSTKLFPHLENGTYVHVNGGNPLTCPTYVGNLVDSLLLAARSEEAVNRGYIVTDGLQVSWKEYIDRICECLEVPPPEWSVPSWLVYPAASGLETFYRWCGKEHPPPITRYRIRQVSRDYHFSIDRARNELGYEPRVELDEGISRTVDWYRSRKES